MTHPAQNRTKNLQSGPRQHKTSITLEREGVRSSFERHSKRLEGACFDFKCIKSENEPVLRF